MRYLGLAIIFCIHTASWNIFASERCRVKDDDVYDLFSKYATNVASEIESRTGKTPSVKKVIRELSDVTLIQNEAIINVSNFTKSDIFAEGFFKPRWDEEQFVVVPALGMGLTTEPNDIVYFCLEFTPEEKNRQLTLMVLEPSWPTRMFKGKEYKRFNKKLVSLTFNPITGVSNILQMVMGKMGMGRAYQKLDDEFFDAFESGVNFGWRVFRKYTFDMGVHQIVIRPDQVDMHYQVRILNLIKFGDKNRGIPRDVPFLKDEFYLTPNMRREMLDSQ